MRRRANQGPILPVFVAKPKIQFIVDPKCTLTLEEATAEFRVAEGEFKQASARLKNARLALKKATREVLGPIEDLTCREREIHALIQEGFINKEIGAQIHIAERTVKFHVTNLLRKFNAQNRKNL